MSQSPVRRAEYEKAGERTKAKTEKRREIRNNATAWVLMVPAPIFILALITFPIFRSLYLSLPRYRLGMNSIEFIGFENYVKLAGSRLLWKVMKNTIVFALMTVTPNMAVGLNLTVLIDRKGKGMGFIRMACFYPAVMPMITIASVWVSIYIAENGLFDQLLIAMGLKPMNVLSSKNATLPAMAVMYVWKEAGYLMVFFLSGTQSISDEVMETARIDRAGSWIVSGRITVPLLAPTFLFVSAIAFTNRFKLVDHVVIMAKGVPSNASILLLYYIYRQGSTNFSYGVSSALTVVMLGPLFVVSLPGSISQDKKVHYN